MCYIMHRYSKEARLVIVPTKYPGANKIKAKETYWLPEKHAIVHGDYLVYWHDYIARDDFDWKPSTDMTKAQARYGLECHKIDKKRLKAVNKSELLKSGISSEAFPSKDDEGITKDFETRPREFWRFRKRWAREFEDYAEWDDTTEVLIFHFEVHRFKPEMIAFDWHIEERLNYQKREREFQKRMAKQAEKDAEDEKSGRKKRKKKKSGSKKKTKKKVNKKTRKKKK